MINIKEEIDNHKLNLDSDGKEGKRSDLRGTILEIASSNNMSTELEL